MVKKEVIKKDANEHAIVRTPNFAKFYVTNVRGGLTDHDFRFELLNEQIQDKEDKWCFVSDCMIILSPIGAKRLHNLLKDCIEVYEKEKGVIDSSESRKKTYN